MPEIKLFNDASNQGVSLKNDGGYKKEEITKFRDAAAELEMDQVKKELQAEQGALKGWIASELLPTQKNYLNWPKIGEDMAALKSFLAACIGEPQLGNTLPSINTFGGKLELIRYALIRAQEKMGVDLHISIPNPSNSLPWYGRPFDHDDLISIVAFQKHSQTYKNSKFDKNHVDTGVGGMPDGILGARTVKALMIDCGMTPEDVPSLGNVKTTQTWKMKQDGSVYLPGPDGKWKPYVYDQKKYEVSDKKDTKMEAKNLSVPMQKLNLFLQFAEGWKEEALKIANSRNKLNSSWVDNEGAQIKAKVAHLDAMIKNTITLINKNPSTAIDYKKFFAPIYEVEMHMEDVIGQDDVGEAFRAINELSTGGYENAEHRIIKAMRKSLSDAIADSFGGRGGGNSEYAKNWLAEENILKMADYATIPKVLEDKATADAIVGGDVNGLAEQLKKAFIIHKNAVPVAKEIIEQYNKLNKNNAKQRPEYITAIRSQGVDSATQQHIMTEWNKMPGLIKVTSWNDYVSRAADEAIRSSTLASTMMLARDLTMEAKLTQRIKDGKALTPQEKTMEDILGVGSFNISDENTEIAAEAGQTLALSAVTMGVGGLVARGALATLRYVSKIPRIASIMSKAANAAKTGTGLAKWAGKTAMLTKYGVSLGTEGVFFYQGSNLATNVITKDIESVSTLFENAGDWKENLKSVAFIGILKGMGNLFTRAAKNPTLAKLFTEGNANSLVATNRGWLIPSPRNLVSMHTLGNFGKIMIQGGMLTTTSQLVEFGFEGEMNWTWGEFFQACLLTRVMHGAGKLEGKIKFTKDPKTKEITAKVEPKLLPPHPEQKQITQGSRITDPSRLLPEHKTDANPVKTDANPVKTDANPVKTDANPVKTDANPVKTDANPVKTDANPVKTENLDGLKKRKGDLEGEIADRKAELEHKKKTAMSDPEKRGNSQGTGTFSPSEVIEYREQQRKLAEEQSIIDAKQKELDTINREINDINAQKILAQKESDHRSQHDQLYKDHEALLKALEDSYGSYNQAESSLKTKTATAGHRNDLESNLTQKEKNGQKILTDITKVEKEINQKRKADGLPEVDFDAIHNKVNKRPIKSGTGSNKPSGDIVGQKNTDAPKAELVGLDGKPLSTTKAESRVANNKAEQVVSDSEQINKGEATSKSEGVVDGKDTQVDPKTINAKTALDNATTIQAGIEAGQKAARGEVVTEKIKSEDQVESTTGGDIVEIDYLGVKNTKVKLIESLADGSKVVEFTEQVGSKKAGERQTISQQTWEQLKSKEVSKGEKATDQSDATLESKQTSEPIKEYQEGSSAKIDALQAKYNELTKNLRGARGEARKPLLAELDIVSKELESARKELLGIDDIPVIIENPELISARKASQNLETKIAAEVDPVKKANLQAKKDKADAFIKGKEEAQKQDEQKKANGEKKEETKESQETVKSKLDAKKSEYRDLAGQLETAKLAEKTPENKQKVTELEQKIRDNVREVQDLKYQELVERYPEHAQTYKDWKSAQEQYGKAREDFFKDFADPSKEISDSQYIEARRNMHDLERKLRDLEWKDMSKEMREKSEKKFQDDMKLIDERYNLAMKNTKLRLNQKLGSTEANIPAEIEKNNQRIAEIDKKLGTKSVLFDEHKRIDDAINNRIENVGKDINGKETSDSKEKKKEEGNKIVNFIKNKWSRGTAGFLTMLGAYAYVKGGKKE